MARPAKNNVEYFPYYCKEGKALFYIEEKYKNDGYATWLKTLRQLAVTNYHYLDLSDDMELMFLASKCKVSENVLISIITDLVKLGEFNSVLWNENRIVYSEKFIESIQDAYSKRNNKPLSLEGLLLHLQGLGVRKPPLTPSKGVNNTQSIVEDIKEKEIKVNKTIEQRAEEFKNSLFPYLGKYNEIMLEQFFMYWTEHGEKDKKMRFEKEKSFGLARRLTTWKNNEQKFSNNGKSKQTLVNFAAKKLKDDPYWKSL